MIQFALFKGKTSRTPERRERPWGELRRLLTEHEEREHKDGRLWSPTVYDEGDTRGKANVREVTCLVLDFDDGIAPGPLRAGWERWEYAIASTFSHTPDYPRWRAVFPLVRPVPAAEWPEVYRRLAAALGKGHTDRACKDASRIYYTPAKPPGAASFGEIHSGDFLDPDAFPDPEAEPAEPKPASERSGARPRGKGNYATLDVVGWFQAHGCYGRHLDGSRHTVRCPWENEHSKPTKQPEEDTDTLVWEADGERLWPQFHCLHDHCEGRGIEAVLEHWTDADRYCSEEFRDRTFSLNGKRKQQESEGLTLAEARERAAATCVQLKEDVGACFAPEALEALALLKRWDPAAWTRCKPALKRAGVSLKDLFSQFPRVRLTAFDREALGVKDLDGAEARQVAGDLLEECPVPALVIPHPYFLNGQITGKMGVDDEGNPKPLTVAFAPIVLTGRMRDAVTGAESLLLAWQWPASGWQSRVVERSQALTGRKLVELAGVGFPVGDDSVKLLVGYLHRLEAANRPALPCAAVSSHLGWQGEADEAPFLCGRTLILPDGTIEEATPLDVEHPETWSEKRICFHGVGEGEEQIVDAFRTRGTLDAWVRTVSTLQAYPRVLIALYAAFAAPLLQVFNVPNFILDYANRTSTGKTTVLRLVGSVWGNPDERTANSVVGTWDATRVWTERAGHIMNGLPLILDDTMKARSDRAVADLIYAVVSGRGRGRGTITGLASTASWRTILFSSGEQPATSKTQDGGTRTRVLSFNGLPFESDDLNTGRLVKRLNQELCENYGHAGIQFLSWFQRNRETWSQWRERYQVFVEQFSANPPSAEAGRLAQYTALISVTGEMVHRALGLPWTYEDPLLGLWEDLAREAGDAAGDLRALEYIVSWAYSHEHSFKGRFVVEGLAERVPPRVSGKWDPGEEWDFLAFYPDVLKEVIEDQGFHAETVYRNWRERGWIETDPNKHTSRVRMGEKTPRMVKILRLAIKEAEEV